MPPDWLNNRAEWQDGPFTVTARRVHDDDYSPRIFPNPDPDESAEWAKEEKKLASGEWVAYGVVVKVSVKLPPQITGYTSKETLYSYPRIELAEDSCWGIVIDPRTDEQDDYCGEVARDLADAALSQARETVTAIQALAVEV